MQPDHQVTFDRYSVDLRNAQLWRGKTETLPLTSQTFAVLRYLLEHAGQVVTKAELFEALWPGTAVSNGALTFCIVELRKALGDNAKHPKFIETAHRRGYRFIAPLSPLPGQSTIPPEIKHRPEGEEGRKVARKLAALLSADVQGYSRLMGQDEAGTFAPSQPTARS